MEIPLSLINETPNNYELGEEVRKYYHKNNFFSQTDSVLSSKLNSARKSLIQI